MATRIEGRPTMVDPPRPDDDGEMLAELVARELGAEVATIESIPPGLGARRFYRLVLKDRGLPQGAPSSLIARVDRAEDPTLRPPGIAPEPPLEPIRRLLEESGLPVPARYGCNPEAGIELLEDLGTRSLEREAATLDAGALRSYYAEACGLLPRLQRVEAAPPSVAAFERRLDATLFAYKADQVITWTLPWALGRTPRRSEAETVRTAFARVAEECLLAPARLAHRDFKAANLYLQPTTRARSRVVMIDLQGAFLAPPEYDLVCLLRDSHVALPEALVQELLAGVRCDLPDAPDPESFARRFALLTITRNGKDLSRYLYAARVRGDARYLPLLPRAVTTLQAAARQAAPWDPRLARLAELFDELARPLRESP